MKDNLIKSAFEFLKDVVHIIISASIFLFACLLFIIFISGIVFGTFTLFTIMIGQERLDEISRKES